MPRGRAYILFMGLAALLAASVVLACGIGALPIYADQIWDMVLVKVGLAETGDFSIAEQATFWDIRLPRVLAGGLVGAALAFSGACMQGLFRNPLADPGLIGISAGASFTASIVIVLGVNFGVLGYYGLSVFTFIGSGVTAFLVYRIAKNGGTTMVTTMLLAGVAINALAGAATGFMTYISEEDELRDLTFWMLGSLGGSNWKNVTALMPFVLITTPFMPSLGKKLNLLALGEKDAAYSGVNVQRLKVLVLVLTTLSVGAAVAISGIIGFIGLVIPHILRMSIGPDHRVLLPASMLLGASVLVLSDLLCRTVLAPTEVPIGIVTAVIGTPVFLLIILRDKKKSMLA